MISNNETKFVLAFKSRIKKIAANKSFTERYREKTEVEAAMDVSKGYNCLSGRAYGILNRYIKKKLPNEQFMPVISSEELARRRNPYRIYRAGISVEEALIRSY